MNAQALAQYQNYVHIDIDTLDVRGFNYCADMEQEDKSMRFKDRQQVDKLNKYFQNVEQALKTALQSHSHSRFCCAMYASPLFADYQKNSVLASSNF